MINDLEISIEDRLIEKIGEKKFKRAQFIAEYKFGHKTHLIEKYYKSILDGYLSIDEEWTSEDIIHIIVSRIEKVNTEQKIKIINEIIDTYDTRDGKTQYVLEKYKRALKNNKIN